MPPTRINPLYDRPDDEVDPTVWSQNVLDVLIVDDPAEPHTCRRGDVPPRKQGRLEQLVKEIYDIYQAGDNYEYEVNRIRVLRDLIRSYLAHVARERGMRVTGDGSPEAYINDLSFPIRYYLGCYIYGIPIFQLTDSFSRLATREDRLDDAQVRIPDDEFTTDALDVATMIGMAQYQSTIFPAPNGIALQEGLENIEPIRISREIIDISIDPTNWENIELFKVISGLIDRGAELSKTRYPHRIYTDY
ncbi:hypothetical protein H0H93_004382 [Arthromyces matolae]|nr:hypothetical protein H0H93_004382 [Arthromyces matolae]